MSHGKHQQQLNQVVVVVVCVCVCDSVLGIIVDWSFRYRLVEHRRDSRAVDERAAAAVTHGRAAERRDHQKSTDHPTRDHSAESERISRERNRERESERDVIAGNSTILQSLRVR